MGTPTTIGYKGDPFEYVDGHYVGHDGFVVPNDFAEFYERFPDHIRRWVQRHVKKSASNEDIDDWTQDYENPWRQTKTSFRSAVPTCVGSQTRTSFEATFHRTVRGQHRAGPLVAAWEEIKEVLNTGS
jgi:hypothetical protein